MKRNMLDCGFDVVYRVFAMQYTIHASFQEREKR